MRHLTLIAILLLFGSFCRRNDKEIKVIPGIGIVFRNDTIKIGKSTEDDIFRVFNIQGKKMRIDTATACGYTGDGEPASWEIYIGEITIDAFSFEFQSSQVDTLILGTFSLESILIKGPSKYSIKINDSIYYGGPIQHIENYFTFCPTDTTSYMYDLREFYGLQLGLKDSLASKRIDFLEINSIFNYDGENILNLDSLSLKKKKSDFYKNCSDNTVSFPNSRFGKSEIINSLFPVKSILSPIWNLSKTGTQIFFTEEYFVTREYSQDNSEKVDQKNLYKIIEDSIFIDNSYSIRRGKIIRASCDTLVIQWRPNIKPDTLSSF